MNGFSKQLSVDSYFEPSLSSQSSSQSSSSSTAAPTTAASKQRKLILHFDQHNTIQVACTLPGRCITVEEGLNNFLTCAVWGQEVDGQWIWHSKEPQINRPRDAHPDVISYFKYLEKKIVKTPDDRAELKKKTCRFVYEEPGSAFKEYFDLYLKSLIYQSDYDKHAQTTEEPKKEQEDEADDDDTGETNDENRFYYTRSFNNLTDQNLVNSKTAETVMKQQHENHQSSNANSSNNKRLPYNTIPGRGDDRSLYHLILPEFFDMIRRLQKEKREFTIILRTMGIDSHNFLDTIRPVLHGKHRDFKDLEPMNINMSVGQLKRYSNDRIELEMDGQLYKDQKAIYEKLNSLSGICAIRDDFAYWIKHNYDCYSAKPLWVNLNDDDHQHILFDDNIRFDSIDDCIVNLRFHNNDGESNNNNNDCSGGEFEYENVDFQSYKLFGKTSIIQPNLIELLNPHCKKDSTSNYYFDKIKSAEHFYDLILNNKDKINKEIREEPAEIDEEYLMATMSSQSSHDESDEGIGDLNSSCSLNMSTRKFSMINLKNGCKNKEAAAAVTKTVVTKEKEIDEKVENNENGNKKEKENKQIIELVNNNNEQQQQQQQQLSLHNSNKLALIEYKPRRPFVRLKTQIKIDQDPNRPTSSTACVVQ